MIFGVKIQISGSNQNFRWAGVDLDISVNETLGWP